MTHEWMILQASCRLAIRNAIYNQCNAASSSGLCTDSSAQSHLPGKRSTIPSRHFPESRCSQTLSDALQSLIPMPTVLNPTLIEPWLRQYQVLPGRTHPVMNGVGHGGFLLHATRVFDEVSANSARSAGIGLGNGGKNKRRKR